MTPNFINIGPGRCATSWLMEALRTHPEIEMSLVKETEYFNTHFDREVQWYENHFQKENLAVGEISSNYYLDETVPERIKGYKPDMKLVFNLRNPFLLLDSFYKFGIRRGLNLPPLAQALDFPMGKIMGSGFQEREKSQKLTVSDKRTLLESVCLADRFAPFLETFDSKQTHFFVFERLENHSRAVLAELYSFLGVETGFVPEAVDQVINASAKPKSVLVARLASKTAAVFRRLGLYSLLSQLHKNELIKKLIFNPEQKLSNDQEIRASLDDTTVDRLDDQIHQLKKRLSFLEECW